VSLAAVSRPTEPVGNTRQSVREAITTQHCSAVTLAAEHRHDWLRHIQNAKTTTHLCIINTCNEHTFTPNVDNYRQFLTEYNTLRGRWPDDFQLLLLN